MKKSSLITFLIVVLIVALVSPLTISAETVTSGYCGGEGDGTNLQWFIDTNNALYISGHGLMKDYEWSNSQKRAPWFSTVSNSITSIIIEEGVNSIGNSAFFGLSKLSNISVASSVESIGICAFYGCENLKEILVPWGVKYIGGSAFLDCTSLMNVELPQSVNEMGSLAFGYCSSLESIRLPDGLTEIIDSTFTNCTNLTDIHLPNELVSIGATAFTHCEKLTSISLPQTLNSIGKNAFSYCKNLVSITIPENITEINATTFAYCNALRHITLPKRLSTIGDSAFYDCKSLSSINFPQNILTIDDYAFYNCIALGSVEFPDSVSYIGESAFLGCSGLTDIKLPTHLKSLENSVFSACGSLTKIELPESIAQIGDYAFANCRNLEYIDLPENLASIGISAFSNCKSLVNLTLPANITTISNSTFSNCINLQQVNLPKKLQNIHVDAFYGCSSIVSITIPNEVAFIGDYAFEGCNKLRTITFTGNSPVFENSCFYEVTIEAFYNKEDTTWTNEIKKDYGGHVTWIPYHNHSEHLTKIEGKEASCEKDGNIEYYVCSCGKWFADVGAAIEIDNPNDVVKPAKGHDWDEGTVIRKATKEETGIILYTCHRCGATREETIPANSELTYTRIFGDNRVATAVAISKAGFKKATNVILASSLDYADALAGAPLGFALKAPILLVGKKIEAITINEIERLGAEKIYILGGEAAISKVIEEALSSYGYKVIRIEGENRYETAVSIARMIEEVSGEKPREVFIASGVNFPDALAVSSIAALTKTPILYATANGKIKATEEYLKEENTSIVNCVILGGESAISTKAEENIKNCGIKSIERIEGSNRYYTCLEINKKYAHVFNKQDMCVATGLNFPDALAGSVYAALNKAPILLVAQRINERQIEYIKDFSPINISTFGGTAAVSDEVLSEIIEAAK